MQQLEARARRSRGAVGEEEGGGATAEEAVGEEHRAVVAAVPVLRDVLGRDDDRTAVAVVGEARSFAARSTAMTEAEQPMPPRLYESTSERMPKRLTNHCRERWRRAEQASS